MSDKKNDCFVDMNEDEAVSEPHRHACLSTHEHDGGAADNVQNNYSAAHRHEKSRVKQADNRRNPGEILAIRSHSGISGDIFLTGLAVLNMQKNSLIPGSSAANEWLARICSSVMPQLSETVQIRHVLRNGISGWLANVDLPEAHEHRSLKDAHKLIETSTISEPAKKYSITCFELLAASEAQVHNCSPEEIHFHEIGALDSILDICATCELFTLLGEPEIICSPLPVADGEVHCAHGLVPSPAPAVLKLLRDVPVYPFTGDTTSGELVTPTGIALLLALKAKFGPWPKFVMRTSEIVYGQKFFENAVNGVIFSLGTSCKGAD